MLTGLARVWGARIVEPVARFLGRLGVTPNMATVIGLFLTLIVAVVLATGRLQLAGFLLIPTLGFDAVDGTLARLTGATSRFGAFLDSTLDRWAEIFLYFALVWHYTQAGQDQGTLLAVAAMGTSLMVSYTRARAEGVGIPMKEGLLTRFERLVILILGLILNLAIPALLVVALLAGLTAVQRILITKQLDRRQAE